VSGFFDAAGVRLCYDVYGAPHAPPMVLLHGLGGDRSTWAEVAPALATGRRVHALDLRGHGNSDRPGRYSFELMRDDVVAFIDALDVRGVALVGHSMGGVVAWLVARQRQAGLSHLVVEDSPPPRVGMPAVPLRDRPRENVRPHETVGFDWRAVEAIVGQLNNPDPAWWIDAAAITTPTLVIAGGPASHVPQDLLLRISAALPDGRLVTIPAGHHIHRTRPADFLAVVNDFLGGTVHGAPTNAVTRGGSGRSD
jgi:pimeloyl-ACP methyl ester carboxylesterase